MFRPQTVRGPACLHPNPLLTEPNPSEIATGTGANPKTEDVTGADRPATRTLDPRGRHFRASQSREDARHARALAVGGRTAGRRDPAARRRRARSDRPALRREVRQHALQPAREQPAAEDHDLRPRRRDADRHAVQPGPGADPVEQGSRLPAGRADRHRGPPVLQPPRRGHPRLDPVAVQHRHRRGHAGRLDADHAVRQADPLLPGRRQQGQAAGRDLAEHQPQDRGRQVRPLLRGNPARVEGPDPRQLPQHRVLRRALVRHPDRRPDLLQQERAGPLARRVRPARRSAPRAERIRPVPAPAGREGPPRRRAAEPRRRRQVEAVDRQRADGEADRAGDPGAAARPGGLREREQHDPERGLLLRVRGQLAHRTSTGSPTTSCRPAG